MEHIRINTRLRLEKVHVSMAQTIFNTIDKEREYLRKWLSFVDYTKVVSDTEAFITSANRPEKRDIIYSIWYDERFAGLIGFKDTDYVNKKTEIGYWLSEKMQGKGIITLCVKKLVSFAFTKMRFNRVQIKAAIQNEKSQAIPKRLGFYYEGIEREGEWLHNKFLDLQVFSMLKKEWLF